MKNKKIIIIILLTIVLSSALGSIVGLNQLERKKSVSEVSIINIENNLGIKNNNFKSLSLIEFIKEDLLNILRLSTIFLSPIFAFGVISKLSQIIDYISSKKGIF